MTYWDAIMSLLGFLGSPLMVLVYHAIALIALWSWASHLEEGYRTRGRAWIPGCAGILVIINGAAMSVWIFSSGMDPISWTTV